MVWSAIATRQPQTKQKINALALNELEETFQLALCQQFERDKNLHFTSMDINEKTRLKKEY